MHKNTKKEKKISIEEAREKAECYEGNIETTKSYLDLGDVSEVYDPEGEDDDKVEE